MKSILRNQGHGTKVINNIIEYADTKNKIVVLCADPKERRWSLKRLMNFYKRFGFIENKNDKFINRFWNDNMYRLPISK
ncbi:hypothetical protein D3C71_1620110 [compost metagenome]